MAIRGVWELVLVSPAAEREYAELAEANRLNVVSHKDVEISKVRTFIYIGICVYICIHFYMYMYVCMFI